MITINFTYIKTDANTLEMTSSATGGAPFVLDGEGEFIHIASPADMLLLGSLPGSQPYRTDSVTVLFRAQSALETVRDRILSDIEQLNAVLLEDGVRGATLFDNT